MWPQWTILILILLGCGIAIGKHIKGGENCIITILSGAIEFILLWFGGFWKGLFN